MSLTPYGIGREAFREGRLLNTNPYHSPVSIREWRAGWYYEQRTKEIAA